MVNSYQEPRLARLMAGLLVSAAIGFPADAATVKAFRPKITEKQSQRDTKAALPSSRAGLPPAKELWLSPVTRAELEIVKPKAGLTLAGIHRTGAGEMLTRGEWSVTPEGRAAYRTALRSPGAHGLRIHFQRFAIGAGKVWLHDGEPDGAVAGPYTAAGPLGDGDFWSDVVFAESVVLEYEPEPGAGGGLPFQIAEISHLLNGIGPAKPVEAPPNASAEFRGPAETIPDSDVLRALAAPPPRSEALTCNLDATCHPDWAERAKSVARYLFETSGGTALCSGALVNTRNSSGKLYFLTADHCVSAEAEARSVQTFWSYATSSCNGPAPSTRNAQTSLGATLLASGGLAEGDYSLLELREVPSGVTFSGWTTTEHPVGTAVTGIHHPRGDYRRISFGGRADAIQTRSRPEDKFYTIIWERGVTEGGSSGSPIFNNDGLIVGMLSGGPRPPDGQTECDLQPAYDWYGRLSVAYPAIQNYLEERQVGTPPPQTGPTGTALASGAPRPFSLGPVNGPTLFGGENAFRIEVPEGATRLEIQVRTQTAGADIDLFVRRGSAPTAGQSVQADYRSTSDTGDETVVITPTSTPALQAGTYYIALALFTPGTVAEGAVTASVTTTGSTPPPAQPGGQTLTSGQARTWTLGPVQNGTLFGGNNAYQITVPQGATRLQVQLTTATANVDMDLFVRLGQSPAVSGGNVVADHRSEGATGNETITINNPQPGTYYIAIAMFTSGVQASGALTATVTTAGSTPPPQSGGGALASGGPRNWSFGPVESPTLFGGENAFQINVPQGATRLEVRVVTTTRGVDTDLFVRFGQAPAVSGGSVQGDFASESESGDETIVITPSSSPALRAGTYYIALALFTRGVRAEGTVVATVTTGDSGAATALISGAAQRFTINPVSNAALIGSPAFRVTVPQGAARLRVQLRTSTPGVDVDLHARFDRAPEVSDGRIVSDHSSRGDTGDEDLAIDGGNLRAGTWYISLAVFTANRTIEGTITAFVDTASAAPPDRPTVLTSGVAGRFTYPAERQATLYHGNYGFQVVVPEGASRLTIRLATQTPEADLDLYVRRGADVDLADGNVVADAFAEGPTGNETITLTAATTPALQPGTYYIGLGVFSRDLQVTGTVTATIERAAAAPTPVSGNRLTLDQPVQWSLDAVNSPTLFSGARAFRLDVSSIVQFNVRLTTDTPGADVDLYVRYGAPPEVQNGRVVADFSSTGLTGNEVVTISPGTESPMRSGTYWIALAVFTPNVATQGTIVATAGASSPQTEDTTRLKRLLLSGRAPADAMLVKETEAVAKSEVSGNEVVLKDKLRLEVTE